MTGRKPICPPVVSWLLVPLPLKFMIQKKKTQEKLKCKGNSFIRKPCPPSVLKTISWYRTFVWIELQIYLIFASCSSWVGLSLPSISLLNLYFRALSHGIRFTTVKLTSYMSIEKYSTRTFISVIDLGTMATARCVVFVLVLTDQLLLCLVRLICRYKI